MRAAIADLEGDNLLPGITVIWCMVFKDISTNEIHKFYPGSHKDWKQAAMDHMDTLDVLIMHNGIRFDKKVLEKIWGYYFKGTWIDTLIWSKQLQPKLRSPANCPNKRAPHSVEAYGYRFGRGKPEHEDWSKFSMEMLHRCTEDVEIQHMIYNWLVSIKEKWGTAWDNPLRLTQRVFEIALEQEEYGWLMDKDHMVRCHKQLTRWIGLIDRVITPYLPLVRVINEGKIPKKDEYRYVEKPFKKNGELAKRILDWMEEAGYHNICGPFSRISFRLTNVDSGDELKKFLLQSGWEPEQWNTDDKGEKTSPKLSKDEKFKGVNGKVGSLIVKRVQCRHRRSTIEGWWRDLREDGRLPSRITDLAATGRAKHSIIVNVPGGDSFYGKQMRQCFICKPGYKIVGTDAAGCQNRMLAARVNDEFFTRTLLEGSSKDKTDIHNVNLRAIIKAVEEHFEPQYIATRIGHWPPTRHNAKTCNYATLFGGGGAAVAKPLAAPSEVGEVIKEAIFGVAPGFASLVENLKKEWVSTAKKRMNKWGRLEYYDGYVRGLDGRPILIEHEHTLLVYILQSDEAIMMETAYCFLYKWATEKFGPHGGNWGFVTFMHDEVQLEVREDLVDEMAALSEKAINVAGEYYKLACEQKGEADVGINWYETH